MPDNKQKETDNLLGWTLFTLVVAVWLLGWVFIDLGIGEFQRGEFGDKFGAINTLFSGLAFAGIIFTILLQRRDLQMQKDELELTRDQLTRSADAQEKTVEIMFEDMRLRKAESQMKRNALRPRLDWKFQNKDRSANALFIVYASYNEGECFDISANDVSGNGNGFNFNAGPTILQKPTIDLRFRIEMNKEVVVEVTYHDKDGNKYLDTVKFIRTGETDGSIESNTSFL